MLRVHTCHDRHVVCASHSRMMRMEEQQHRTRHREHRKNPCRPNCFKALTRSLHFDQTQTKKQEGEDLVLDNFGIRYGALDPWLRTKGPEFCIAVHKDE